MRLVVIESIIFQTRIYNSAQCYLYLCSGGTNAIDVGYVIVINCLFKTNSGLTAIDIDGFSTH